METRLPLDSPLEPETTSAMSSPILGLVGFEGKLAFHSDRYGVLQIFQMDGKSGEITQLTNDPAKAVEPDWSPDCTALAFTSGRNGMNSLEVYTMNSDGSDQTRLFENQPADDWAPSWSPDGETIAYQSNESGKINVCFAGTNGEEKGCLIAGDNSNALPSWHPNGDKIVFLSDMGGDWEIHVATVGENSASTPLSDNRYEDLHPRFSPDGNHIAFASKRSDISDIFVIDADGSNERRLTNSGSEDVTPRWIGDDHLVFASDRTGNWELYMMDTNGQNLVRLTHSAGMDKWPSWCAPIE